MLIYVSEEEENISVSSGLGFSEYCVLQWCVITAKTLISSVCKQVIRLPLDDML